MKTKKSLRNIFYRSTQKKPESNYLSKYFTSIKEIPIYNWFRIFEDKDYKYALLDIKSDIDKGASMALVQLQNSYIEVFGFDDKFMEYLRAKIKLELLNIKFALTKERGLTTFIKIAQHDMERKFQKEVSGNSMEAVIAVEKHMGFKLNQKETTAYEFYFYLQNLRKNANRVREKK